MEKLRFNKEEYKSLKHRLHKLQSRVELDNGPEHETAVRLLAQIKKKLKKYEETHDIPEFIDMDNMSESAAKTTSSYSYKDFCENNENKETKTSFTRNTKQYYQEDTRTEEQLIKDLGVLYLIFGSTYCTVLNYHTYKIRFKNQREKQEAFYRVFAEVYEDDICICKNITIGFWPFRFGDTKCGDMEMSTQLHGIYKYNYGCTWLYLTILSELQEIWNDYFDSTQLLTRRVDGFLENSKKEELKEQLSKEQRIQVIKQVELGFKNFRVEYYYNQVEEIGFDSDKSFESLNDLIDYSGVVYKVESDGVYIFNYFKKTFQKLLNCVYDGNFAKYTLYVLK